MISIFALIRAMIALSKTCLWRRIGHTSRVREAEVHSAQIAGLLAGGRRVVPVHGGRAGGARLLGLGRPHGIRAQGRVRLEAVAQWKVAAGGESSQTSTDRR